MRTTQPITGKRHSPPRQIFHYGGSNPLLESLGKHGAGHAHAIGQFLECPRVSRFAMNARDGNSYLRISKRKQQADARTLDNVLAAPHLGYVSHGLYKTFYEDTVSNIRKWIDSH